MKRLNTGGAIAIVVVFSMLLVASLLPLLVWSDEKPLDVSGGQTKGNECLSNSTPNLSIAKTSAPDPVSAGGLLTYTITTVNDGDTNATNVIITDAIPENTVYISGSMTYTFVSGVVVTQTQPISITSGNVMTWEVSYLATSYPTNTITTTFQVTVTSPLINGTIITNTANVTCEEGVSDTHTITTEVESSPILEISKSGSEDLIDAGEILTYTITVTNSPSANANATSIIITDVVPKNTTFITATNDGFSGPDERVITWTRDFLGVGSSFELTFTVRVTSPLDNGTLITNTSFITCEQGVSDSTSITTTVASTPALHISKIDEPPDFVKAGGYLTYTISISNTGNGNATGVKITETIPINTNFVTTTGDYESYETSSPPAGQVITWEMGYLRGDGQETKVVILVVTVTTPLEDGTLITNTASVTCAEGISDTYTITTEVESAPIITISKEANVEVMLSGTKLLYTISFSNTGNMVATGVVITDIFDTNVRFVKSSPPPDGGEENIRYWKIDDLEVNNPRTILVTVTANVLLSRTITNTVILDSEQTDRLEDIETTRIVPVKVYLPILLRGYPPRWSKGSELEGIVVYSLGVCHLDCKTLYAGTGGRGVYKSDDEGRTWEKKSIGLGDQFVLSLAIDPKNCDIIYATTWGNGVYKTADGGMNWEPKNNGLEGHLWLCALAIDPDGIVYAGTATGGVYKTTNGGEYWEAVNNGLAVFEIYSLAIDPNDSQVIYAGTKEGVYKTVNGSDSWQLIGLEDKKVWSFAIDPSNTDVIYAGTEGDGVYKTTDGVSWTKVGLEGFTVYALVIDQDTTFIYAGTKENGVYISTNKGASWKEMNTGLGNSVVEALAIGKKCRRLHAGTKNGAWWYPLR